jgi:hypothetical protein
MKKTKTFDCVGFQRKIRYQHYLEANGDVEIMLKNMEKRLETNYLWKELIARQEKARQQALE